MNQLTFGDVPRARTTDPETSHAAAASSRGLAGEHRRKILAVMAKGGDWTADEIAERCDLNRHQIGRRLGELERSGAVQKSINTRPTPSGRQAQCYEVTP